jgi:hypothetical protein
VRRLVLLAVLAVAVTAVIAVVGEVAAVRRRPAGVRTLSKSCTNRLAAAIAVGGMPTCFDGAACERYKQGGSYIGQVMRFLPYDAVVLQDTH